MSGSVHGDQSVHWGNGEWAQLWKVITGRARLGRMEGQDIVEEGTLIKVKVKAVKMQHGAGSATQEI